MALNVKIGKIGPLDMLKFSKMPDVREKVIESTPLSPLPKAYASNAKAELYHPKWQKVVFGRPAIAASSLSCPQMTLKSPTISDSYGVASTVYICDWRTVPFIVHVASALSQASQM